MQTTAVLTKLGFFLAFGIVVTSCAPDDLGRFGDAPVAARPPDGGANSMMGGCTLYSSMTEIQTKLLGGSKCSLCHGKMTLFPTTFDSTTPDLASRVVDKPAEGNPAKGKCSGKVLVPRDNPLTGVLYEKVSADKPSCGDRMPQSMAPLSADEIACVKAWVMMAAAGMH